MYNKSKSNWDPFMVILSVVLRQPIIFLYVTIVNDVSGLQDCLFEIRKIAVCFLWLSLPGDYRVTDEALLAETT